MLSRLYRRYLGLSILQDKVELSGKFCMGKCGEGVSVDINDTVYSVKPEEVDEFFKREVLEKL